MLMCSPHGPSGSTRSSRSRERAGWVRGGWGRGRTRATEGGYKVERGGNSEKKIYRKNRKSCTPHVVLQWSAEDTTCTAPVRRRRGYMAPVREEGVWLLGLAMTGTGGQ
jgi:hypothetical protein